MVDWATASDGFWSHVDPAGDCWAWTGEFIDGNATVGEVDGVVWSAHRFAYINLVGPIPAGTGISRACRNSACVNPDHLEFAETNSSFRPGQTPRYKPAKTLCSKGHLYDKMNIYRRGKRVCGICQQDAYKPRPKPRLKKRKRARKAKAVVHGRASTYQYGCRCDECKAAGREYQRNYYASRKKPPPEPRPCAWCNVEFQPHHSDQTVLCSSKCRSASYRAARSAERTLRSAPGARTARPWVGQLRPTKLPAALVTEWFIEPDPDLVMLQEIAIQEPSSELPQRPRRKSKRR